MFLGWRITPFLGPTYQNREVEKSLSSLKQRLGLGLIATTELKGVFTVYQVFFHEQGKTQLPSGKKKRYRGVKRIEAVYIRMNWDQVKPDSQGSCWPRNSLCKTGLAGLPGKLIS